MVSPVYYIDTFTNEKFKGNPTAVCVMNGFLEYNVALSLAREFNLPVTAFVDLNRVSDDVFPIRYFTSSGEITACGHATLAAAKVVSLLFPGRQILFQTIDKMEIVIQMEEGLITMLYPSYVLKPFRPTRDLLASLGIDRYLEAGICKELDAVFIELNDAAQLGSVQPDYVRLISSSNAIKEVVVTSASNNLNYDFFLRSFCPWIGINEDPVTGSVHSVLAGYWATRTGKSNLKAWQASARGGEVFVKLMSDRVRIAGNAVVVLRGEILL